MPRATTAQRIALTPDEGELIYDTNTDTVWYGNGVTAGGVELSAGSGSMSLDQVSSATTHSVVSVGTTSTSVLASNAARKGGWVKNISDAYIYVCYAATALTTIPTKLAPDATLDFATNGAVYTGVITAIVAAGTKSLEVVEL